MVLALLLFAFFYSQPVIYFLISNLNQKTD